MRIAEKPYFNSEKTTWLKLKNGYARLQRKKDGPKLKSRKFQLYILTYSYFRLSDRNASQGLIAVTTKDNIAALLELNCETDFVGRSADFKNLVEEIVWTILEHGKKCANSSVPKNKNEFVSIPFGLWDAFNL